jgi:hypothetical protein
MSPREFVQILLGYVGVAHDVEDGGQRLDTVEPGGTKRMSQNILTGRKQITPQFLMISIYFLRIKKVFELL